jgi:hypothetical protein
MPFEHGAVRCSTFKSGNSLARLRSLPFVKWTGSLGLRDAPRALIKRVGV